MREELNGGVVVAQTGVSGNSYTYGLRDESNLSAKWLFRLPAANYMVGSELIFIGSPNSNAYLVVDDLNYQSLYDYRQNTYKKYTSYSNYTTINYDNIFKLPSGVTKLICIGNGNNGADWIIE